MIDVFVGLLTEMMLMKKEQVTLCALEVLLIKITIANIAMTVLMVLAIIVG